MYIQAIYHYPAIGKAPELIAALAERNKASNAAGVPHMVAQRMFGPEPAFVTAMQFQDLAAIETWQASNNQPESQATFARISASLARPQSVELAEQILPAEPTGPVSYILSASYFPSGGRAGDLRAALEQRINNLKLPGAVGIGLNTLVAPEDGATFTVNVLFADLAGFETAMHEPAFRTAGVEPGLLSRTIRQRLYRVLMPFGA
jgi:hypothetical protein